MSKSQHQSRTYSQRGIEANTPLLKHLIQQTSMSFVGVTSGVEKTNAHASVHAIKSSKQIPFPNRDAGISDEIR